MAYIEGTAPTFDTFEDGHRRFFRIFRRFVVGAPEIDSVDFTGVGNGPIGKIDTYPGAPAEIWTITFTDDTNFTVTGSVTGAEASGTTGADYDNGLLAFRINVGGTAFETDDEFVIEVVDSTNVGQSVWVEDRYDPHSADLEWIAHGTGYAGTDAIYVGTRMSETPASNQWNMEIRGFTGFDENLTFTSQPGISPATFVAFWNQSHPYWISVTPRRWTLIARASTTYHAAYAGFLLPYTLPSEYPYPLAIGGENSAAVAWSSTSNSYEHFVFSNSAGKLYVRAVDGSWKDFSGVGGSGIVWPCVQGATAVGNNGGSGFSIFDNIETVDTGVYPLFPMVAIATDGNWASPGYVLGEFEGLYYVPGFNLSPEDVITIGGTDYIVTQDIFRSARDKKWCLEKS